jgi:hypothetical protein
VVDEEPDIGDRVLQDDVVAGDVDGERLVEVGRRRRVERAELDRCSIGVRSGRVALRHLGGGVEHPDGELPRHFELLADRIQPRLDGGIGLPCRLPHPHQRRAPMNMPLSAS